MQTYPKTDTEISEFLHRHGAHPTSQRVAVARVLFTHGTHLSAEDVYKLVNTDSQQVSKATVYNTLGLFAEKGIVREVVADPSRIFYDPNTAAHHHFFNVVSGELTDIDASQIQVTGLPPLPPGADLEGIDVVVRLRQAK